jgi:hypothetical protein
MGVDTPAARSGRAGAPVATRNVLAAAPQAAPSEAPAAKLWGGRFTGKTDPLMEKFNESLPFDKRMWAEDIRVRARGSALAPAAPRRRLLTGLRAAVNPVRPWGAQQPQQHAAAARLPGNWPGGSAACHRCSQGAGQGAAVRQPQHLDASDLDPAAALPAAECIGPPRTVPAQGPGPRACVATRGSCPSPPGTRPPRRAARRTPRRCQRQASSRPRRRTPSWRASRRWRPSGRPAALSSSRSVAEPARGCCWRPPVQLMAQPGLQAAAAAGTPAARWPSGLHAGAVLVIVLHAVTLSSPLTSPPTPSPTAAAGRRGYPHRQRAPPHRAHRRSGRQAAHRPLQERPGAAAAALLLPGAAGGKGRGRWRGLPRGQHQHQ